MTTSCQSSEYRVHIGPVVYIVTAGSTSSARACAVRLYRKKYRRNPVGTYAIHTHKLQAEQHHA